MSRVSLTAEQITHVVDTFYDKVRRDPELGPVFARHVHDWPAHTEKISRFWRNAILHERVYDGNPMQKHRAARNVHAEHFAQWLRLFDQTLAEALPPAQADAWSELAHRIGRSLKMGLAFQAAQADAPNLRAT